MEFQELPEDVIRSIFGCSDVYSVISLGGTNRYFHRLSMDKLVWVDLVVNLRRKGFIDRLSLSDIQSSSQEALVALVKRSVTGPESWYGTVKPKSHWSRSSSHQTLIEMSTKHTVHPGVINTPSNLHAGLLNGGEYVLIDGVTIECWSVQRDKLVWTYDKNSPESFVEEFTAEVIEGGCSANIMVCESLWTASGKSGSLVQIVGLDFDTGTSTSLFVLPCPEVESYTNAKICDDLASAVLDLGGTSYCLLMNWKTKAHLTVVPNARVSPLLVTLVPNHVIFLMSGTTGSPEIRIINSTALSPHWRLDTGHPILNTVFPSQLDVILCEKITFEKCPYLRKPFQRKLYAYESPLQEGTYRIWIMLYGSSQSLLDVEGAICSYHFSLPNKVGDKITWRQRTVFATETSPSRSALSYSGHTVRRFSRAGRSVFGPEDRVADLKPSSSALSPYTHVATYSGALTSVDNRNNEVLISYYT
ncbi:F-box domain-containing protein [Mycena venus]|uniref:F-box domain-containing protein n=1 Tax=Mycena venus TaxID=2733690 RepID=A0A8H6YJF8_9AGAR|nr:F-box domain-containing protein [Mycena venus]